MKSSHIIIGVVVLILLGVIFLGPKSNKNEDINAEVQNTNTDGTGDITNSTGVNTSVDASVGVVASTGVKEFTITATNFSFAPSTITVNKGDKVKVIFKNTEGFHDFIVDGYGAATKQLRAPAQEVIEFTADKSGSFEYYCSVGTHRQMGMKGTLVVK